MSSKLPLAIIGCGYWGSKHVRVVHETPGVEVASAVDFSTERLDYIASQYKSVPVSRSFEDVLRSDAAGVIIATPISTHFALAKAALLAGKHVLIEKPMARTSAECRELIRIAEQRRLVLMVGHTFEYHPAVAVTRDIVRQGRLGKLYYVNSRRLNLGLYRSDVNVLWDLAPHDLSIIFSILDSEIENVSAWGCRHALPSTEDVVYARMDFESGATAHLHVSWLDPVKVRQFTVVGSEGMLVFDDVVQTEKIRVYDKRFKPVQVGDGFSEFHSTYRDGDVFVPEIPAGEPLQLEVLDFANAILTGAKPLVDGWSGLRVVEALERTSACISGPAPAMFREVVRRNGIEHRPEAV